MACGQQSRVLEHLLSIPQRAGSRKASTKLRILFLEGPDTGIMGVLNRPKLFLF
jgi:hypothetical protein